MVPSWLTTIPLTLVLALPPSASPTIPDVLLPGHKAVQHEIVLEWDSTNAPHRLVAFPVRGFGGHTVIEPGQPFSFSSKYGTRIYAVPRGIELPDDREAFEASAWANTRVPVGEVGSVPIGNPLARLETVLRVQSIGENEIEFEPVRELRFDANGAALGRHDAWWLLLVAAAGAVLLTTVVRKKRAANTPVTQ